MLLRSSIENSSHILQCCMKNQDRNIVLELQSYVHRCGLESHSTVGNLLVIVLIEAGPIENAKNLFNTLPWKDQSAWHCLINGYLKLEKPHLAFQLYTGADTNASVFDSKGHTFVNILKPCIKLRDIRTGLLMHAEASRTGLIFRDPFVGSSFVGMYAKCGSLLIAQEVFEMLPVKDVVSWTTLIRGYVEHGHEEDALDCLKEMQAKGFSPNAVTYVCCLKACSRLIDVDEGRKIHVEITKKGFLEENVFVGGALVDMYARFGLFDIARRVCSNLPVRNVVSWNSLIAAYVENGNDEGASECFLFMKLDGVCPDSVSLMCVLKSCSNMRDIKKGQVIHAEIERKGLLQTDIATGNTLVDMYAKCGLLASAQKVFDNLPIKDVVSWTVLIGGYAEHGHADEAIKCFEQMREDGISPNPVTFVCRLKACGSIGLTEKTREIHAEVERLGLLEKNCDVANTLIDMYAKLGMLSDAQEVFDTVMARDEVSWNALIAGYVEHGHENNGLKCLDQMRGEGILPTSITFICSLRACGILRALCKGQELHNEMELKGYLGDLVVANALIDMYMKCGQRLSAQKVFDRLNVRDLVTWTTLIEGYIEHGNGKDALQCFRQMQVECVPYDAVTLVCGLKACGEVGDIDTGKQIHGEIEKQGLLERDIMVGSTLIYMYANCGSIAAAQQVFGKLTIRTVVVWNTLIVGYAENGHNLEAVRCFERMQLEGVEADAVTYAFILKAYGSIGEYEKVRDIHTEVEKKGLLEKELMVGNALIDLYGKYGSLKMAQEVFDKLRIRNVVSWTALVSGYTEHSQEETALKCLEEMELEGINPDHLTLLCALKACCSMGATERARDIHFQLEQEHFQQEGTVVGNTMVDIYGKCGWVTKAQQVFENLLIRSVVSWNALMIGYIEHGDGEKAAEFFDQMQVEGVRPDAITFLCSLKAYGSIGAICKGVEMHSKIERLGLLETDPFMGSALIDMYSKCGSLVDAEKVFHKLSVRDVVSWNTMILAYAKEGEGNKSLQCVMQMQSEGVSPTAATFICTLKACGNIGAMEKAREIHAEIERSGLLGSDILVANTLVDTYAKCGFLSKAADAFDKLLVQGVISWTALMAGYAHAGESSRVFHIFERMLGEGIRPDPIAFVVLLNACSRGGSAERSRSYYEAMSASYGIVPSLEHHACVMNLFSRTGRLQKAAEMVGDMGFCRNRVMLQTMLSGCRYWGNMELGKDVFQSAIELEKD